MNSQPLTAESILSKEEESEIVQAIQKAEKLTSGEIRVHLSDSEEEDHMKDAIDIFHALNMHETKYRNGVLVHIGVKNHVLTIIADKGINDLVATDYWQNIIDNTLSFFRQGQFKAGLVDCILSIGHSLKHHFPYEDDDIDELPNEISKG